MSERNLRVLMVVRLFYPWVGGAERQAHKLAKRLVERGVSVELVTGWWFWGTPQCEVLDGISIYRNLTLWEFFGIRGLRKFGGYLYILTLLWHLWRRRDAYDLIHVHGLNYHTFAAVLAGQRLNRKVITKLANSGSASDIRKMQQDKQLALSRFMVPTALQSDCFVALNRTIVDELAAAGVPLHRIVSLPNGVACTDLDVKQDYALHTPVRMVFVGRLHPQKGLDTLLRAVQRLLQERSTLDLRLQLLGDGPLRADLAHLAEQLQITRYVEFWGERDDVLAHLPRADLFVLPSRAEGISNALLEAMACGLPVIVSQIPGNVELVQHERSGLLFPVDNERALAEELLTLIERPALRARLGRAARATVENEYSLDSVAARYVALYRRLLGDERVVDSATGAAHENAPGYTRSRVGM